MKKAVLDLVKKQPDDCTLEDVQYGLYVRQKVEHSMQAAAVGRVSSHEQVIQLVTRMRRGDPRCRLCPSGVPN